MDTKVIDNQDQKQGKGSLPKRKLPGFSFRNMRLQTRLTLLVLVIALPILLSISTISSIRSANYLRENIYEQLHLTNDGIYAKTDVWFQANASLLKQLSTLPEIVSMDAAQQKPVLETTSKAFPNLFLVQTTDITGMNVARNDSQENKDYNDREWFRVAAAGSPVSYEAVISRTTNKPALNMAAPIRDEANNIIGVASIVSDLSVISKEVLSSSVTGDQNGMQTFVVDASNKVIAHPDPAIAENAASLTDYTNYPPVKAMVEGKRGIFEYRDEQGVQWLAYLSRMDTGWGIITQIEFSKAFTPIVSFQTASWVGNIIGVVLLVVLSALIIRSALQPIHDLTDTAAAIAAGDYTREARVERDDEIGRLARTFNDMTRQLRGLIGSLEQRVTERTRVMETSAQISRRLSTILNPSDLVREVVNQLKAAFGYYHVHIYLFDESKENLVMAGGTGEAGQAMLARGHKILKGRGLVGRAADTKESVLVNDTLQDPGWLPNPLLPETRSELAVPIAIGSQVLGVLDVQGNRVGGLSEEDKQILQSVADQVGIAVQNAQAYTQAQQQAHHQEVVSTIGQRIQRAGSVDEVLQIAVSELGKALGAQKSSVELRSPAAPDRHKN